MTRLGRDEEMVPGTRYRVYFDHDLGAVTFEAMLVAIYDRGEIDPLVECPQRDPECNEVGWQGPRTYWDNGLVMDGGFDSVEFASSPHICIECGDTGQCYDGGWGPCPQGCAA